MSTQTRSVDFFVGLFVLIGLGMIAAMVLIFGRAAQGLTKFYPITVEFPNASGLVKGCDVFISGAHVGTVAQAPQLMHDRYAVAVELNVDDIVKIPRTSSFQIRTNGMLGDAYVDIVPPTQYTKEDFAKPGELIEGMRMAGLDELTTKGGELFDRLNKEILIKLSGNLDDIKTATTTINGRLLSEKNLKNIEDTFADLAKTSKDLESVMMKTQALLDSAKGTMETADSSAEQLKLALGDLRKMADTATKTIDSAKVLINKATAGDGAFGALVSDKQMADDLKTLIANLRRSGVLFYKDRAMPGGTPAPAAADAAKKRR